MLSKKIFFSLKQTKNLARSSYLRAAVSSFGSCGSGACGSKKSLTKFTPEISKDVMENMPISLAKPTLRNTKIREKYSEEFDRTPHC